MKKKWKAVGENYLFIKYVNNTPVILTSCQKYVIKEHSFNISCNLYI